MSTVVEISEELMAEVALEAERRSTTTAELVQLLIRGGLGGVQEQVSPSRDPTGVGPSPTYDANGLRSGAVPPWFGVFADRVKDRRHDMASIRRHIGKGIARERGF
jgi:hypothetical protein